MVYTKPLPQLDAWNRPFWEGCREHRLIAQKCLDSGEVWLPPSPISPVTRLPRWEWTTLSGRGRVVSWVIFHKAYFKSFAEEVPYLVAQVELEEGPNLITRLKLEQNETVTMDMPVEVYFLDVNDQISLPCFRARRTAA